MTLDNRQQTAIRGTILAGEKIRCSHPEVALMYRDGYTLREIANSLELKTEFPNLQGQSFARAIGCAIRGHDGGFGIAPYQGLITDNSELKRLAEEHNYQSSVRLVQEGKGVHKLSIEQRRAQLISVGHLGRQVVMEKCLGVVGRAHELRVEDGRKAAIANGYRPWIKSGEKAGVDTYFAIDEKVSAYLLSLQDRFLQLPPNKRYAAIALELDNRYHDKDSVRTINAIKSALRNFKAKQAKAPNS